MHKKTVKGLESEWFLTFDLMGKEFGKRFPSWIHGLHRMHLITESGCHPVNAMEQEE
jgi:hypothetical protein